GSTGGQPPARIVGPKSRCVAYQASNNAQPNGLTPSGHTSPSWRPSYCPIQPCTVSALHVVVISVRTGPNVNVSPAMIGLVVSWAGGAARAIASWPLLVSG